LNKCDECGEKFSTERKRITVQYLSGDYESCQDCVDHAVLKGYVTRNQMDFLVGKRMYYKGMISIGVLDHIKTVFDERMRGAS